MTSKETTIIIQAAKILYYGKFFQDYSEMSLAYRPSHADATYDMKYGVRSVQVLTFLL